MNKREAAKLLSYIVACMPNLHGKDLTPTATAWALVMPDIPAPLAEKAIVLLLRERKISTLPLPGEIIEVCEQIAGVDTHGNDKAPTATEAWQEVKKHLNAVVPKPWSHKAVEEAVKTIGARTIAESTFDLSAHFMKVYNSIVSRHEGESKITAALQIIAMGRGNKKLEAGERLIAQ